MLLFDLFFFISASLGGSLGLCVGASFLTFYEFAEFIFLRTLRYIKRKWKESDAKVSRRWARKIQVQELSTVGVQDLSTVCIQ